jgi:Ca2+-binding RTX toxin-like protein
VGGAGADVLTGGLGIDRASYAASAAGVTINLITGVHSGGDAAGDTLDGIEDLEGSQFADVFSGSTGDNLLLGLRGDDILIGFDGNDTLKGGVGHDSLYGLIGNDVLFGEADNDDFLFLLNDDQDTVADFENDIDSLGFDDSLWGGAVKTADQILTDYAVQNGANSVFFDFGGGDTLTVNGTGLTVAMLSNDIFIF